jgi:hypothetical protein
MLRELSAPPEADPEAEAEVQRQAEDHARNHRERAMTGGAETERRLVRRGMA